MIFGATLLFKVFQNFAFKNVIENGQNTLYLAFNFQFKIYLDF
jgi:hypothetical protein